MMSFVIAAAALAAGILQTVTGFGSGIFMMLFYPIFLSVLQASALSSFISLAMTTVTAWHYRRYIRIKDTAVPALFYILTSSLAVYAAPYVPKEALLKIFGLFLLVLAIYFLFFPKKVKVKASLLSAGICASLSGLAGGLFGIGGPPMVIYFLAATGSKEEYLGTIQFFFWISGLYTCALRIMNHIYTPDLIPLTLLGMISILTGVAIGRRIIDRINGEVMKKVIYVFLAVSGILNLF